MTRMISAVRFPEESVGVVELWDPVAIGTRVMVGMVVGMLVDDMVGSKVGAVVGASVHVEVTVTETGTSLIAPEIVSITY